MMKDVKYLINAAGVFSPKAFLDHTEEDYDAYLDLNRATFFVTQRVAKNMVANGGGSSDVDSLTALVPTTARTHTVWQLGLTAMVA